MSLCKSTCVCIPFSACYEHTQPYMHPYIHAAHMHTCTHSYITLLPHIFTLHTCRDTNHMHWQSVAHKETHCTPKPTGIQLLLLTCSHINASSRQCTQNACVHHGTSKSMTVYVDASCNWCMCLSQCFLFHIFLINYSCMYLCIYCRCLWGRVSIR